MQRTSTTIVLPDRCARTILACDLRYTVFDVVLRTLFILPALGPPGGSRFRNTLNSALILSTVSIGSHLHVGNPLRRVVHPSPERFQVRGAREGTVEITQPSCSNYHGISRALHFRGTNSPDRDRGSCEIRNGL